MKRGLALALGVATLVRIPFWLEALRTPVDGDTAIVGLMARHPFSAAALWGQPYGSPLDAWFALPFLAVFASKATALRVACFSLGLALVALAYGMAREVEPRSALPAGLLMACPSAYMLVLSALPPPLYSTTLVVCGLLLLLTLRIGERLSAGESPPATLALLGGLGGLALWTHLMSAAIVVPCVGYLATRGRARARTLAFVLVPLVVVSFPWWRGFLRDPAWTTRIVAVSNRDESMAAHLRAVLPRLHAPIGGLLGTHSPVLADDPDHVVAPPAWVGLSLALIYGAALVVAARRSRLRGAPGLLLACVASTVAAFPFPLRSSPTTIRFLTPAYLPWAVLAAWAFTGATRRSFRGPLGLVLVVAMLDLLGGRLVLASWRTADRAKPPFGLQDLAPLRRALESAHVRRAYGGYETAYRLTFETGERILVSEPWNERFRHYPLPYLDDVRFAKNVAWVLGPPGGPGDLPTPRQFEDALGAIGGRWKRSTAGAYSVFLDFSPPFGPTVESPRGAGPAGDRDLSTRVVPAPTSTLEVDLGEPRRLDGLTLVGPLEGPGLLTSMDVEVSADGRAFETVARRRRREERHDLRWLNGHPQYVVDNDVIAVALGGRPVTAIRVVPFRSAEPWAMAEVLLHPAEGEAARRPWSEWLDPNLTWPERRAALAARPLRDREDWYSRSLLAHRHR